MDLSVLVDKIRVLPTGVKIIRNTDRSKMDFKKLDKFIEDIKKYRIMLELYEERINVCKKYIDDSLKGLEEYKNQ